MIQLPLFIIMVMSIRMISHENADLTGAGMLWFPNLNEPDPYMILPIMAAALNYFNLTVSIPYRSNHLILISFIERHHQR